MLLMKQPCTGPCISYLVEIPKVTSSGKSIVLDLLPSTSGGFRLISLIDLNCDCSCAVVNPDLQAATFNATKSLSGLLISFFTDFLCAYQCDTAVIYQSTHYIVALITHNSHK